MTYVAVSTLGLLVPLSCVQSGLGVVVDRLGGARRNLLTAPIPRQLIVASNLVVAVALSSLQVLVVVGASALRGAEFAVDVTGVGWFVASTLCFSVAMYGIAEVLANRLPTQEDYIGALLLPITHVLALMRYGLVDRDGQGLHDIWGIDNTTAMAALSAPPSHDGRSFGVSERLDLGLLLS